MTVKNKQIADQNTFNNAFISRTANTSTVGTLDLLNTGSDSIADLQTVVNSLLIKETEVISDYTIIGAINTVLVDASSNAVETTLPVTATSTGTIYNIVALDVTNAVTIVSQSGTILGESNYTLKMNYESIRLFTDGVNWYAL